MVMMEEKAGREGILVETLWEREVTSDGEDRCKWEGRGERRGEGRGDTGLLEDASCVLWFF